MKAAWEQLGDEFAGSSSVLIGDVDCTVESDLCQKEGVNGYPTIKYWKDGQAESYNGGRDFSSLLKHTRDNLAPACQVADTTFCTDKEKDFIEKTKGLSKDKIDAQLLRLEGMSDAKVKPELGAWIKARIRILKQLQNQ